MKLTKTIILLAVLAFSVQTVTAQRRNPDQQDNKTENKAESKSEDKTPAKLEEFIKDGTTVMEGMTPVYFQDKKYYIGI
ncbi:MAG: hypothetical protein PHW88_03440, partial [Bacteroidales bacterium]|nr:hypothetical protein [Bacteroidales bacterium]